MPNLRRVASDCCELLQYASLREVLTVNYVLLCCVKHQGTLSSPCSSMTGLSEQGFVANENEGKWKSLVRRNIPQVCIRFAKLA